MLLPRIFDADGAGRALRDEYGGTLPTRWLAAALRELPREQVLDGCVSRFLRGGEAQDLRFFVRLHTLADPTPAESASRLRDYLRLLPSAPGPVAELAAGQVREATPLDHADLVEAVEALTFRAEAKLAAQGLRRLDQTIRATPETAADFVGALTTAYAHTSFDVRNRAAELTLKHAELFADHTEAILDGVHHLPAGLGATVAERFGGEAPAEDEPEQKEFPPLPEVAAPKPFPEPSIFPNYHERWIGQERWLAAFVAGIAADRKNLRRKLKPHVDQDRGSWRSQDERLDPDDWQSALAAELVTPGSAPGLPPIEPEKFWDDAQSPRESGPPSPGARSPNRSPGPAGSVVGGLYRPGRYLGGRHPAARLLHISWNSDEGPDGAVAREGDRQIPLSPATARLTSHLPDSRDDEHARRCRRGTFVDRSVFENLAELRRRPRPDRRRCGPGKQVPPPGPDEPLLQVSVVFVPPRLRSFHARGAAEHDEWRRRNRLPHPNRVSPPHDFLLHRYAELAEALRDGTLPPVPAGHADLDERPPRPRRAGRPAGDLRRRRGGAAPGRPGPGAAATAPGQPPRRRPTGPPRSTRTRRARPPAGWPRAAWPIRSAASCGGTWWARPWSSSATANPNTSPRSGCSRRCG